MLNGKTNIGESVCFALRLPANQSQCMESDDEGDMQGLFQMLGHHAGHEKIGVYQVVRNKLTLGIFLDEASELRHVRKQLLFGYWATRPCRNVYDIHIRHPCDHVLLLLRLC